MFILLTVLHLLIKGCISEECSVNFGFYFVKVNVLVACVCVSVCVCVRV